MNQCWLMVSWAIRKNLQSSSKVVLNNKKFSFMVMHFEMASAWWGPFFRLECFDKFKTSISHVALGWQGSYYFYGLVTLKQCDCVASILFYFKSIDIQLPKIHISQWQHSFHYGSISYAAIMKDMLSLAERLMTASWPSRLECVVHRIMMTSMA